MTRMLAFLVALTWGGVVAMGEPLPVAHDNWSGDPLAIYSMTVDSAAGRVTLDGESMVRHRSPRAGTISFTGKVTPLECAATEGGWAVTGLALVDDERNFWHLALVLPPSKLNVKPFIELEEMRNGIWNSVNGDRLKRVRSRNSGGWKLGETYSMTIRLDAKGVSGEVRDSSGNVVFDAAYGFAGKPCVMRGRPAIRAGKGFRTAFGSLACERQGEISDVAEEQAMAPSVPYAGGGNVPGVTGKATGFFHVEQDADGRWWTIDPNGRGMVLTAVDHVTWHGHYCQKTNERKYLDTNRRRYGTKDKWEVATLGRLKEWGFNSFGAGGDRDLRRRGLAHMEFLSLGGMMSYRPGRFSIRYNEHHVPCGGFPNVFDPSWEAVCRHYANERCAPNRNDPWLFGYFIDNELTWWGEDWAELKTGMYNVVSRLPKDHTARMALEEFNARHGVKDVSKASDEVKAEFLRLVAERYFSVAAAAIRAADPNHMVMGARFANFGGADEIVWEVAGKYCDVVTLNCYPWADLDRNRVFLNRYDREKRTLAGELARHAAIAKRPVIITEWSFPALDSGLKCLHGAGQRFHTQAERTQATMLTAKTFLSVPEIIGYSYFMWVDEPYWGIRPEFPEDSNYGLVSEKDEPYPIAAAFAELHRESGRWHRSPVPTAREMPEDAGETAGEALAKAGYAGKEGVSFTRNGAEYRLENRAGFVLEGRIGGNKVFDRVTLGGKEFGDVTAMLNFKVDGKMRWENVDRVTDVKWDEGKGTLTVRAVRERGQRPFALTHVYTLFPDKALMLDELVRVENLGKASIDVEAFFFRQGAAFATKPRKVREVVPNLWKAVNADCWEEEGGSRRWGCSTGAAYAKPTSFYVDSQGFQHPDAWIKPKGGLSLPPGTEHRPAAGTVWVMMKGDL